MPSSVGDSWGEILEGDVLTRLAEMPAESVNCVVTSPPYWSLRKYDAPDVVWGGDPDCEHEWGDIVMGGESYDNAVRWEHGDSDKAKLRKDFPDAWQKQTPQGQFCARCRAWLGQFGLEPTPELYVEHTLDVLRGIRRVLRPDGVVFWNIGDGYWGSAAKGGSGAGGKEDRWHGDGVYDRRYRGTANPPGLKPKDLVLMPFRVALAAQAPQPPEYKIKSEVDRAWLAAMLDGEGCVYIHRRWKGRKNPTYGCAIQISNTNMPVLERCRALTGMGTINKSNVSRRKTIYRWCLMSREARVLLRELYPYIIIKRVQIKAALAAPSSGPDAEHAWDSIKKLNQGEVPVEDVWPEPKGLVGEPGWYVRSVIVWNKPNCMPESAKDRPTTAHEYILMLTKNERYWWDQEAVREPHSPDGRTATTAPIGDGSHANYQGGDGHERWPNSGRNLRSVWTFPTAQTPEAHFATFPPELPRRCIEAACPREVCAKCGTARVRLVESGGRQADDGPHAWTRSKGDGDETSNAGARRAAGVLPNHHYEQNTIGWSDCGCEEPDYQAGIVLDPFAGVGTTLYVARQLGRRYVGIELSPTYAAMARQKLATWWAPGKIVAQPAPDGQEPLL